MIKNLLYRFRENNRGYLLQIIIALFILGATSAWFWSEQFRPAVEDRAGNLRTNIENDTWL